MIKILKSNTADTRTCDFGKVSGVTLLKSTMLHRNDVKKCMEFFSDIILESGKNHDNHKLSKFDDFYKCFKTGFEDQSWYEEHKKLERHHIDDSIKDLNLIDILEYIADCSSAGLARSGSISKIIIDSDKLMRAFENTVELLKNNLELVDE